MFVVNQLVNSTKHSHKFLQNVRQGQYSKHDFISVIRMFSKIGFIGLGAMGSGMAKNLLKQKKELIVFDVNNKATENLSKEGAQVAGTLEELVASADCIITMLPADKHVMEVYSDTKGIFRYVRKSSLLIDSSTVDPNVPQTLSSDARKKEVMFIDAPVSGGILAAASGQLTFMVGGTKEEAELCRPILSTMGKNIVHCGPCGSGQIAKICNNLLLGISMVGVSEAMNLGIRLGMDPKILTSVINTSSGRCWSSDVYNPVPDVFENVPSSKNYEGGFLSKLILKDLTLAKSVAERSGTCTPLGEQALNIFKCVCESGKANNDFSIVYQYIKHLNKN